MKILMYLDQEVLLKVVGKVLAVSAAMPTVISPEIARALENSLYHCSVPISDEMAERVMRELSEIIFGKLPD